MKDIVIIPIREHSKGVRNKNIFLFNNNLTSLEMINMELNKFDKKNIDVFVNTESQLFKLFAQSIGLKVLDRSPSLSRDSSTLDDVIEDIINSNIINQYKNLWVIQATCPLISYESLKNAKELIEENPSVDTVFSATFVKGFLWQSKKDSYERLYKNRLNRQEQDNKFIAESGAVTISRISKLFNTKHRYIGMNCKPLILGKDESIDIDEFNDLNKVNLYLKSLEGYVIFITKGDENIGSGHIYRTITLASEINSYKKIIFCKKNNLSQGIFDNYEYEFFNYENISEIIKKISNYKIKAIVLDKLETDIQEFIELKKLSCPLISMEDYGDAAILYADKIINSLYETSIDISKLYSGYKYEVIRPDVKAFATLPNYKLEKNIPRTLLICFGGTDPNKFMFRVPAILELLDKKLNQKLKVKLIYSLGEDNNVDDKLKNYENLIVSTFSHSSIIAKELYESDILLSSNGRMIYEATLLNNIVISIPQNSRESTHTFCRDMPGNKQLSLYSIVTNEEVAINIYETIEALRLNIHQSQKDIRDNIIKEIKLGTSKILELIDSL